MALTGNADIQWREPDFNIEPIVDGAIHIYRGALLNYEAANIGYLKLASDTSAEEFAGIATEELNLAAADNAADGTYETKIWKKGCGKLHLLKVTAGVTIAEIGDIVYADGDDAVDFTAGVTNNVEVGVVKGVYSATHAWVQI